MPQKIISPKYIVVLVSLLCIAFAWHYVQNKPVEAKGSETQAQPQPIPVQIETIQSKPVQIWQTYSARLSAVEFVEVRPQISGKITSVNFQDGEIVEKGKVLFTIDPRPYEATLNQEKAELAAARQQSSLTWKELKRAKNLIETNAISKRILDERSTAHTVAAAQLKAAQARVDRAAIDVDYASVKAPISGRLSRAEIKAGNLVQAGPNAPILTSIISTDKIYADFEVDEPSYLNFIKNINKSEASDKKIPVILLIGDNIEREGHIDSFDNRIDVTTGTIRARAILDNNDGTLLPGMFATVKMGSPTKQNQITINEKAIGTDQDRKFVYIVNDQGIAEYRQIEIGDSIKGQRVILSGLNDDEQIITKGIIRIRPGTPVTKESTEQDKTSTPETE